jgi:hypothetical protein
MSGYNSRYSALHADQVRRQGMREATEEKFNSPEWKERWNSRGLTNSYESSGRNNPDSFPKYNAFGGERHQSLLRAIEGRKVEKNPYAGSLLGGIADAISTTGYKFPREFHNERVDEIVDALNTPSGWNLHLQGKPIFPPGVTREIYRRPDEAKKQLPGLIDTFIDSFKK